MIQRKFNFNVNFKKYKIRKIKINIFQPSKLKVGYIVELYYLIV